MPQQSPYDLITARHYAAYRPPLHAMILKNCLQDKAPYRKGLDIGCGTGHSTMALLNYCRQLVGLDPSPDMIQNAQTHPRIQYVLAHAGQTGLAENSFDLITFVGSLFYAKSQAVVDEICRIGADGASVLVYDFEVLLEALYAAWGMKLPVEETEYDHALNFSGLKTPGLQQGFSGADQLSAQCCPAGAFAFVRSKRASGICTQVRASRSLAFAGAAS
ncbi:MAG: class I SAM-dependent methyltransferase [Bacteroidetes bacterium]|nr:MAG: class I SAM-dependent methyltransferase [Bacteroidota bacterium]